MRLLLSDQHSCNCWSMYCLSSGLCDLLWDFVQSMYRLPIGSTGTFQRPLSSNLLQDAVLRPDQWKLPAMRQQLFELFWRRAQQLSRVFEFDLGPPRRILCAGKLRRECNGRYTRTGCMPLGSRLRPPGVGHLRPSSAAHRHGHQHAGGDEHRRRRPRAHVVGDLADGARMRLYLPLRSRALPAAHAREARTTDGCVCGVEEHRRARCRVAREARLAVFARATGTEGGESRAARRAAAESRGRAAHGGAGQARRRHA